MAKSAGRRLAAWLVDRYCLRVCVIARRRADALVALGDSITDGDARLVGSAALDRNQRGTDFLARRLATRPRDRLVGVLNAGISGNRILTNLLGDSALARFDRDVLAQPGARWVIVLAGTNDINSAPAASSAGYDAMANFVNLTLFRRQRTCAQAAKLRRTGRRAFPDGLHRPDRGAVTARTCPVLTRRGGVARRRRRRSHASRRPSDKGRRDAVSRCLASAAALAIAEGSRSASERSAAVPPRITLSAMNPTGSSVPSGLRRHDSPQATSIGRGHPLERPKEPVRDIADPLSSSRVRTRVRLLGGCARTPVLRQL